MDGSGDRSHRAEQHPQQRRLAGARRADDADELPGGDAQVDVDEHGRAAVGAGDAVEADQLAVVGSARHCGYVASSGATLRTSIASQRRGVAAERLGHRDVVEAHQAEPRVLGVAGLARQVVVAEHVDVLDAGLAADLLEHRAGEHLGAEDRRHVLGLDLVDELGDLARRRVLEVGHLDRADHLPAVVLGEVGVGVVVGQQLALRDRGERRRASRRRARR